MRSKGSRFTGGLGVEGVFPRRRATVRNRSKPLATVRNRPREVAMALPMVSSAIFFGGFKRRVASFRVAGVALRDTQTCLVTCRKSFVCGRRNTCATFSEDALQFSWHAQHFRRVHFHFAGQAQHVRRVLWRDFANRIVRAASRGDKVQIPWQAWHL